MKVFLKFWLPVLLWMFLIFGASADTGSSQRSSRIIEPVIRWLIPSISDKAVDQVVFLVRKCAHVSEYGVLALLMWRAVHRPAKTVSQPWNWKTAAVVIGLAFLYASSDEIHQRFVPNREGRFHDVLIDTTGAALALLTLRLFYHWQERRKPAVLSTPATT